MIEKVLSQQYRCILLVFQLNMGWFFEMCFCRSHESMSIPTVKYYCLRIQNKKENERKLNGTVDKSLTLV